MNLLEMKIHEIRLILEALLESLEDLSDDNFEAKMAEINSKTRVIDGLKARLKKEYDPDTLRKYEPGLQELTKQLSNKFDNIITTVKTEKDAVALELKNIQNKKKLVNYNR